MTTRPESGSAGGGVRLRELIERYGALGPEPALVVLRESLIGLAAALEHGIVHRDYRPENVLIDRYGGSQLTGFDGTGSRMPAGLAPYQAPELRYGAPVSGASNVYAATAVFFECLTGSAPSPERIRQFERQQLAAAGPAAAAAERLLGLVAWGMAARPAGRPVSAGHLITELDDLAAAWYGPDWHRRGRRALAERAAGLLAPGDGAAGSAGRASRPGRGARRPGLLAGAAVVAAVAVLAVAGTAVALSGHFGLKPAGSGQGAASGSASSSSTAGASTVNLSEPGDGKAAFTADATVTPAATTSACATPAKFTISGTVSATAAGTVTYQWIGSSGMTGQVQTLDFSGEGTQRVTGTTVRTETAGTYWAAIKIVSPRTATSNKATYTLDCSDGPVTISATAAVTPTSRTVSCAAAPPAATFTGTIDDAKAGTVTYYWELPTGNGPTRSLTFSAPGEEPAAPATVTAASDSSTESGTLVVLSPAAVSSNTATFSVSCTQPATGSSTAPASLSEPTSPSTPTHPADFTVDLITDQVIPKTVVCGSTPPAFEVMATFTPNETFQGETFHWVRPDGTTTTPDKLNLTAGDTGSTSDIFSPASDNFSGTETLVFTSPVQGSWSINLALNCSATASPSPPPSPPQRQLEILMPADANAGVVGGTWGVPFSTTFTAINGTGPYTWSATGLPPGLTINASTGTISGTPTTEGGYGPRITVTDSGSPPQSASGPGFTISIVYPPIVVSAPQVPEGTVGTPYPGVTFSATGGNGTYFWSADPIPAGLTLNVDSGVISGTPTVAGTFKIYMGVGDIFGDPTNVFAITLVVNPASLPPKDLRGVNRLPRPPGRQAAVLTRR
jgi:eukaryotic-like serine/threonine-protein kinase